MTIVPTLAPHTPVVFALDRTGSMHTRDCPEGISRWDYMLGAVREAMNELCKQDRPVHLVTFGSNVRLFLNAVPGVLDGFTYGDARCCTVDAAITAMQVASPTGARAPGHVVLITDGLPEGDTPVGEMLAANEVAMHALFARVQFLTVGKRDGELESFARKWPNSNTLESLLMRNAASYGDADPHNMPARAMPTLALEPAEDVAGKTRSKRR